MTAIQDLSAFLLLLFSSFCAGRKISKRFYEQPHWLDDMLASCGLGFGLVSFVMLAAGFAGLLYLRVIACVPMLLLAFTYREGKEFLKNLDGHLAREKMSPLNTIEKFFIFLMALAVVVCFLICFSPSLVWDELHYHLPVPSLYLKAHHILWLPYLPYSNFPQLVEMLFLPVLALSSAASANFVHGFFAFLTVLVVYRSASFFFSRQAGILGAAVFLFVPVALALAPTSYVDFGFSFYGLLSFYFLVRGAAEENRKLLILSCVFLGLSFCTKYSAIFFYGICVLYLAWHRVRAKPRFITTGFLFLYAATPVFFVLPYLFKNMLLTGNPVYPFLFSVFGGKGLTAAESKNIVQSIVGFGGMGKTLNDFLLLPWNMTLHGERFFGSPGPFFLACLPPFIAAGILREHARVRPFLFFGLAYLMLWFHGTQQTRFLLPSLAAFSVAAGYLFDTWMRKEKLFFALALPFLLGHCVLGAAAFYHFKDIPTRLAAGAGMISRQDYLSGGLETYDAFRYVNAHLTQKDRVYLVNDNRGYYCNIPAIPSSGSFMLNYDKEGTDAQRYGRLKAQGITHFIFNGILCFLPGQQPLCAEVAKDAQKGYMQPVFQKNEVYVLKVLYENVTQKSKPAGIKKQTK